jgi:chemotaxis regulatin CheY-phosphate phosphatase CheZ
MATAKKIINKLAAKPSTRSRPTAAKAAKKPTAAKAAPKSTPRTGRAVAAKKDTGAVLKELKLLAKDLSRAAKGLEKKRNANDPKQVSAILGNVERMTAEAATKSLIEAESAKTIVVNLVDMLGKDWSRQAIESGLKDLTGHLTNIIVAQEFQDLAGQSIRQAMKALVGAVLVVEGGGPTEDRRLSQYEVDSLLNDLM